MRDAFSGRLQKSAFFLLEQQHPKIQSSYSRAVLLCYCSRANEGRDLHCPWLSNLRRKFLWENLLLLRGTYYFQNTALWHLLILTCLEERLQGVQWCIKSFWLTPPGWCDL